MDQLNEMTKNLTVIFHHIHKIKRTIKTIKKILIMLNVAVLFLGLSIIINTLKGL